MSIKKRLVDRWPADWPLQPFREPAWAEQEPTYREASPSLIEAAVKRAGARQSGNWFVVAASRDVRSGAPFGVTVGGVELVLWRTAAGRLAAGPGACPHLGAPLADARVHRGELVCRWHGLRLGEDGLGGWSPVPCHDDGVLAWVRLDRLGGEEPTGAPVVPRRPAAAASIDAVATVVGTCEPEDIVANRLDPWHGAWFHPYSFAKLRVLDAPRSHDVGDEDDRFRVEVTFRVASRWGVPVLVEFTCPEPRTVVMHIVEGEGEGSVVETHATPLGVGRDGRPRTAVIEATIAASGRPGFALARKVGPVLRPLMRRTAARLWRDDLDYAERRWSLRDSRS
ncbi:DUF5914 domain-containing protein [Amycolatopsis sp. H20-H5]|uniref:DUF5914 domain-containing protein n=1 Tax=Amycolatopsis sp. H20-H5 TaxID=3046309 RepID=UPI002DB87651|nr:DUF5914 domain-containing protein [Amycolatopsis sp. H20-H5]MEC3982482.1 DUF5914 domain-containing protein [Amycolatopsis sp. H20-H5]